MGDEQNGHSLSRLDRMEGLMQLLIDDHLKFSDEHNRLLTAQIVLTDAMNKTAVAQKELAVAQKELAEAQTHTDRRMDALIAVVDGMIRKPPSGSVSD
jgi:hypothetical protein